VLVLAGDEGTICDVPTISRFMGIVIAACRVGSCDLCWHGPSFTKTNCSLTGAWREPVREIEPLR
jgi:hypothetical protein